MRNLRAQLSEDILNATWSAPLLLTNCITRYGIITWNQESTIIDETTVTATNYAFTPVYWCMEYNIMVKPMIGVNEGVPTTVTYTMPAHGKLYIYYKMNRSFIMD